MARTDVSETANSAVPAWPKVAHNLRLVLLAVLFWTLLGMFFASQMVFFGMPWRQALAYSMPRWYAWGLLAPGVFWADRRLLGDKSLAARVAWHVPLGFAWTFLCIALRLVTRPLRDAPPATTVTGFFLSRFYWDLLIYAVIAGVSVSLDFAARTREREHQANELALEAADLERRLTEARLQSLRAQLHPHFLFNALNTISAFTETDPPKARRLMENLGDLLRASLKHASQPLVTLGDELTFLDDYLAIESARFEGRITVSVDADDELLSALVPCFLLQPLVENAIRHGVAPRLSGGHVDVTATREGPILKLRVRDDGIGFSTGWRFETNAGIGLRNVASRIEQLYHRGDLLRIVLVPAGGAEVQIDLPLQSSETDVPTRAPGMAASA